MSEPRILVYVPHHGTLTAEQREQRMHELATCEATTGIETGKSFLVHALRSLTAEQRTRVLMAVEILCGGDIEEWRQDPTAQKKMLAAVITREIAALANELRKRGIRNPVTRAEEGVAKQWQHASGHALNRWLRRNR